LRPQVVHLRDGQTGVVGHDNGRCARKRIVQFRDEFAFLRSIHFVSPVGEPAVADRPAWLPFAAPRLRGSATLRGSCPLTTTPRGGVGKRSTRVRTVPSGLRPPNRSSPVSCGPVTIKDGHPQSRT